MVYVCLFKQQRRRRRRRRVERLLLLLLLVVLVLASSATASWSSANASSCDPSKHEWRLYAKSNLGRQAQETSSTTKLQYICSHTHTYSWVKTSSVRRENERKTERNVAGTSCASCAWERRRCLSIYALLHSILCEKEIKLKWKTCELIWNRSLTHQTAVRHGYISHTICV